MRFGPWEIGLILVIILIVFGVGRLPQVGSSVGKAVRSFRQASHSDTEEEELKPVKTQRARRTAVHNATKSTDKSA